MDKIDKIIFIIRNLREEISMNTSSTSGKAGFGGSAQGFDPGPTAGYDKVIKFDGRSKIARRLPHPYKNALINLEKRKK